MDEKELQKKLEELQNKHIDDKFSNLSQVNSKNNDKLDKFLERLATLEGYQKGKDDANKKWLDIVMRSIPIIISVFALITSVVAIILRTKP